MKTNKQSKIKVPKSGYKRSRFNWSHDVNSTFRWGEIQPVQCKMIQPNSKTTISTQSLIRLAPMVAPTFGRVKYKTFNQFVDVAEIFPNYDAMMAQEPVNRNGRTKVPQKIPSIKLGQLSAWCFMGARASLYWTDVGTTSTPSTNAARFAAAQEGKYMTYIRPNLQTVTLPTETQNVLNAVTGAFNAISYATSANLWSNIPGAPKLKENTNYLILNPKRMDSAAWNNVWLGDYNYNSADYQITLGNNADSTNEAYRTLLPLASDKIADARVKNPSYGYITAENADYLIEFKVTDPNGTEGYNEIYCCLALEFSDYGKRLRKIIQGCGYPIDITSTEKVSILPLLAQYKAYFDIFGLQLYQGWETTYCAKLIDYIKNNFIEDIDYESYGGQPTDGIRIASLPTVRTVVYPSDIFTSFLSFMFTEIANEWYTEEADFFGAHMSKLAVSPEVDTSGFISVDMSGWTDPALETNVTIPVGTGISLGQSDTHDNSYDYKYLSSVAENGVHEYIKRIQHSQTDSELLKRIYKWTNRNSILGREIAKILRAQGLGDYVDECKSNFIGSTDNMITISDVVSMADTDTGNGTGALLGEYGGKGLQYIEDKTLVFENDALGYWITLATIIPEAGYVQGLDPVLTALDKFNLYNPDFDALGMEMTKKSAIVGTNYDVMSTNYNHENSTSVGFGFIPRYSKFKVAHNLVNGDFNRHNQRNTYLPYTLDKQISSEDFDVARQYELTLTTGDVNGYMELKRTTTKEDLPVAGNVWRIPTKYPWLGNFNRIFHNVGKLNNESAVTYENIGFDFLDYNEDNFLMHSIVNMNCYAPMKPIEESYGLEDEDNQTIGAEYVNKT